MGDEKILLKSRVGSGELVPIFMGVILAFCLAITFNLGLYSFKLSTFNINGSALMFLYTMAILIPSIFIGSIKMRMWMLWWLLRELAVSFFDNLRVMLAALPVIGKCCGGPDHMDDYEVVQILEDLTDKSQKQAKKNARRNVGVHYSRDGSDSRDGSALHQGFGKDVAIPADCTCGLDTCAAAATQRCAVCEVVYYCSVEHQQSHWKAHQKNCRARYTRFDQMRSAISTKLRCLKKGGKNLSMSEDDIDKEVRL